MEVKDPPVESHGITRQSALKIGALGLAGAMGAMFMPRRASAGTIYPAPCKPGQGFMCSNGTLTGCGGPGSGCGCATLYTGRKIGPVKSYCVDMNVCCDAVDTCSGPADCPAGWTCSSGTCCGSPVCLPPCGNTSVPPAVCCTTPTGQSQNNCGTCTGGNCNVGFSQCGCVGPVEGSFCFTTTENTAVCAQNEFCSDVPSCTSSSQCAAGWVCITENGCTGCASGSGVCVPLCTTQVAVQPKSRPPGSMTAANIRV